MAPARIPGTLSLRLSPSRPNRTQWLLDESRHREAQAEAIRRFPQRKA